MAQSSYSITQLDEGLRKILTPYSADLYVPILTPVTGLSFDAGVRTKLVLNSEAASLPRGFDLYTTPEGPALMFIGSGLGNGDSFVFDASGHASVGSANQATLLTISVCKRQYTEPFTSSVDIPGFYIKRNQPNNDTGAVSIVAPKFVMNDGDLLDICVTSTATVTGVSISAFAFKIKEA